MQALLEVDGNILLFIQENLRNPVLTPILQVITRLGDHGYFWVFLTLALLLFPRTRKTALYSFSAMLICYILNNMCLKYLVNRTRPYMVIDGLELLVPAATDPSFPSGHSAASFASALAIYQAKQLPKAVCIGLLVLAGVIALSRLYVGIHYPTDVIGGTLIGLLCALAGVKLCEVLTDRLPALEKLFGDGSR